MDQIDQMSNYTRIGMPARLRKMAGNQKYPSFPFPQVYVFGRKVHSWKGKIELSAVRAIIDTTYRICVRVLYVTVSVVVWKSHISTARSQGNQALVKDFGRGDWSVRDLYNGGSSNASDRLGCVPKHSILLSIDGWIG